MKSLLAVLALTSALGVGYWKTQNPEGGIDDAKAQAQAVFNRLGTGIEAIKDGGTAMTAPSDEPDPVELKLTETDNRLQNIEELMKLSGSETDNRLATIEESLAAASAGESSELINLGDTLKSQIAVTDSQLEQTRGQLEQTREELQATGGRLNTLEQALGNIPTTSPEDVENRVQELESTLGARVEELATQLDTQLKEQSRKLNAVQGNTSESSTDTQKNLEAVNEKLAALDSRLNTLSSATGGSSGDSGDTANLTAVTAQIDQRMAAMEARISAATNLNTRTTIDNLQEELIAANKKIAEFESRLGERVDLGTSLSNVESEIGSLRSDYSTLQSQVESSAIENSQNDLQQQLKNLEDLVKSSSASTDVSALTTELEQSRSRIQALEQRVTELPASSDSASAKKVQDALQSQIAALENRLANTVSKPDQKIESTLNQVQQKVSALESREYVTAEQLQKMSQNESIQYKIYFGKGSTDISPEAAKVLNSFIAQEANRATSVSIFGTTDRSGSSDYNQRLALQRANRVRSYLIQRGFEFTKINEVDGIGEDLAAAKTADGKEDANQRSVILFAFQP